jgi:hypothetical protein
MLLLAVPVSVFVTLLLLPLWRLMEARLEVEAVGHSGPAGWCFVVSYVLVAVAGGFTWFHRRRRG